MIKTTSSIRTLVSELQEYFQQKVPELLAGCLAEMQRCEQAAKNLDPLIPNYWHERSNLDLKISSLKTAIQHYRNKTDEKRFALFIRHVTTHKIQNPKQVFLLEFFPTLVHLPTAIQQRDRCHVCGSSCIVKKTIARLTCLGCGCTRKIITNLTGPSTTTTTSSSSSTKTPAKRHSKAPGNAADTALQRNEHVRLKWLHKQLQQYKIGSKRIAKEDIFAVARRLRSIHLKSVSVVKHTITRSILKALNKTDCVSQASKIADILNGTPVAAFNDAQFLNVLERLVAVQKVFIMFQRQAMQDNKNPTANPEKGVGGGGVGGGGVGGGGGGAVTTSGERPMRLSFPPFQFLLKHFCILEKWHELQECFTHSKTLDVYQTQISEWRLFLPYLKRDDPKHVWDYPDDRNDLDAFKLL